MARPDPESYRLERRVAAYVAAQDVLCAGERALLMLSGGADSMALLALVSRVSERLGLGLHLSALHVDYATRGVESARDREIVTRACAAAGVPLRVVRLRRKLEGGDFQARARELRYRRARALAAESGCDVIVTAHNRDDQAETVLYRLTKYATPRALAGMRPRERELARPLLCLGAGEIRAYCMRLNIEYGEDASNSLPVYARNVLRLEVLPVLRRLNPRAVETLADAAAMAAAEDEVLATAVAAASERVRAAAGADDLEALDVAALVAEPPALGALVLHDAVRRAWGGDALVERRVVAALLALCARREDAGRVAVGRGVEALRSGGVLRLRRRAPAHACAEATLEGAALAAAGGRGCALAWCGRAYRLALAPGAVLDRDAATAGHGFAGLPGPPARVTLRHPRRAERFAPLGLGAETTVGRFLAHAHAPTA